MAENIGNAGTAAAENTPFKMPVDCEVRVTIASNSSEAYVTVDPPQNGGSAANVGLINAKLREANVVYGISEEAVQKIVDERIYDQPIPVAFWTPAVDGKDGSITYRFEKKVEIAPVEDEHGFVDYKNLGLVRTIHKGDIIADITLPTDGTPGTDVKGKTLRQRMGKKAQYTIGTNTALTDDGTQIVSTTDGNVNFKGGAFVVDQVVTIAGDLDASVGNIDFVGDVVVKGEVMEGFKISSNANIIVSGNVNGATLEADGDIIIKKGCIKSNVIAHGSVSINFCEYSNIKCDGTLTSSNFVVCDVYCGELSLKGNSGGLMGGKYTSLNSVEIPSIGTKNYAPTILTLGDNALYAEEKNEVLAQIEKTQKSLDDLGLIINFLNEKKKELKSLPEEKEKILGNACRQKVLLGVEISKLNKRVGEIDTILSSKQLLSVSCKGHMYPGVKVIINDTVFKVSDECVRTKLRLDESGEIVMSPV